MKGEKKIVWAFEGDCIRCLSHFHDRQNYPLLRRNGERFKFARHILFRKFGRQPENIITRHTCDNSWCVNPDHITIGTHGDNCKDKIERGRLPIGEKHWNCRLTDSQVQQIRDATGTQKSIAVRFGLSRSHVASIKLGYRRQKETMRTLEG